MPTDQEQRPLYRLVYRSRATTQTLSHIGDIFPVIMATACRKNTDVGVTGALLACSGWFLQALEGPRDKVSTVYKTVCDDRRHFGVKIISETPVATRAFANWSMCGRRISGTDDAIIATLEGKGFDPERFEEAMAMRLLNAVRQIQGKPKATDFLRL